MNQSKRSFDRSRDIILFFTPEAAVTPHFAAQCVLAKTFTDRGYNVLMSRCSGEFARCPVMDMYEVPYSADRELVKENICVNCDAIFEKVTDYYGLKSLRLGDFRTSEIDRKVNELLPSPDALSVDFEYDGVPFGKVGGADTLLINKRSSLATLEDDQRLGWYRYTRSCLNSYLLMESICKALPVRRVCIFNAYALLMGPALYAEHHNMPVVCVSQAPHLDHDRRRFIVLPETYSNFVWTKQMRNWYRWRDLSLPPETIKEVMDDLIARQVTKGVNHYSPKRSMNTHSLFQQFGFSEQRKTLVAFTSSLDEIEYGHMHSNSLGFNQEYEGKPFIDQLSWLDALIDHVEASDDLQLAIRIHPREAKGSQQSKGSEHLVKLKQLLSREMKYCKVVWPEDDTSSYDLIEMADVGLTAWSAIGLEMARFGTPVIQAFRMMRYPDDDFYVWGGESPAEYFRTLKEELERSVSKDSILRAFRCYNYMILAMAINMHDVIPGPHFEGFPEFSMPAQADALEKIFIEGYTPFRINRARLKAIQSTQLTEAESNVLEKQLQRLLHYLLTSDVMGVPPEIFRYCAENPAEYESESFQSEQKKRFQVPGQTLVCNSGPWVYYFFEGKMVKYYNKVAERLIAVCTRPVARDLLPQNSQYESFAGPSPEL